MKVAFFQSKPGIGPVTNDTFRFSQELSNAGHKIHLVGTVIPDSTRERAPENLRLICLGSKSTYSAVMPLVDYLKKERPSYLLPSGAPLHVASAVAKNISGFDGGILTLTHTEMTDYLLERSLLNRTYLKFMLRRFRNTADGHLASSRGAADNLAKVLGLPKDRIGVLYNPAVDDTLIARSHEAVDHPWLQSRSTPLIVCAARLVVSKGIDVLIDAMRFVTAERKVRLILLGSGPLEASLKQRASGVGLADMIDFRGHVDNPYAYMRQADLFVLPTNYEGFANVIAEALACGCPVVSTDAPSGPREILADGNFGTLVPRRNPAALASAICASLDSSHDKARLVERGMRFHAKRVTPELLSFLEQVN